MKRILNKIITISIAKIIREDGIRSYLIEPTRKRLITNFFSLASIQGANYLIPLLILPYIVRIIGPNNFGLLSYSQTFVYYFTIIINYSFDYTATREISLHREDKHRIVQIYSNVLYCKLLLFSFATLVFVASILLVNKFNENIEVYLITYLINIGFVFFPSWFYQGIEKLNRTAVFNLLTKVIFAVLVVLFIKKEADFYIYALSASIAQIVIGIAAFMYGLIHYDIELHRMRWLDLKKVLFAGSFVFLSNIAISLYTTTNLIILGFYTSEIDYGFFSAALKISSVINSMIILPLGLTLFPHIARLMNESKTDGIRVLQKYIKWISVITLLLGGLTFLFAENLITLLFGNDFSSGALYLKVLAFMPFVSALNNLISVQGLLNLKKDRIFLGITGATFVFSLLLNLILVPQYGSLGTSIIQLSCEIFMVGIASVFLFGKTRVQYEREL